MKFETFLFTLKSSKRNRECHKTTLCRPVHDIAPNKIYGSRDKIIDDNISTTV